MSGSQSQPHMRRGSSIPAGLHYDPGRAQRDKVATYKEKAERALARGSIGAGAGGAGGVKLPPI